MADPQPGGCCRCCFSFIFTLGLTALFMWLSLRTSNPKCSIKYFYLPALNRTLNDTTNTTLYLSLRLNNGNKDKGIYYDTLNLTFRASPDTNNLNNLNIIGNASVPAFYQGHKKKATKTLELKAPGQLNWTAVSKAVFPNGTLRFRVDLATAVRFKIMFWKTKRHRLMVGGLVEVNGSGGKVNPKKDVKLSASPDQLLGGLIGQVGFLVNLLVFIFLNFL